MRSAIIFLSLVILAPAEQSPPRTGCRVIAQEQIVRVQGARIVLPTHDLFPESAVQPSGDGQYWGCWMNGILRDLYVPPGDPGDEGLHINPMSTDEED